MSKVIKMKLWEGWRIIHNGKITECASPKEVWEHFNWDVDNDPNAKECATEITRAMYCFGYVDLTPMLNGKGHLFLEVIPCEKQDLTEVDEESED